MSGGKLRQNEPSPIGEGYALRWNLGFDESNAYHPVGATIVSRVTL